MNVLFDDSVDFRFQKRFAQHHPDMTVSNLAAMGWSSASDVMYALTSSQKDRLLLTLAFQADFHVFITADTRFYAGMELPLVVVMCDAGRFAPTLNFLNSVVPALDNRLAQITQKSEEPIDSRLSVLRSVSYDPNSSVPVAGSRLASAKLRPIEREAGHRTHR